MSEVVHANERGVARCGATDSIVVLTDRWVRVECIACVAIGHPLPSTRSRAVKQMQAALPRGRDQGSVEKWLAEP